MQVTEPTLITPDGTALKNGDIWVSNSRLRKLSRFTNTTVAHYFGYLLITLTQTTEDGILFADARYNTTGANSATAGTIVALMESLQTLDPRCSDSTISQRYVVMELKTFPGFNVKKFVRNSINTAGNNIRFNNNES